MKPRILVIRGGAIGDFILTLPSIRLLRESFPAAHIEILGYRHIVALAEGRWYADAARSIEYRGMAGFFVPGAELEPALAEYFASFQQVVSWLYDPEKFFENNVRRAGVKNFLPAFATLDDSEHAARQLARPLQALALYLDDHAATIHPSPEDRAFADAFLGESRAPVIALHPGSGSARKNWPLERWRELAARLRERQPAARLLLVGGEADTAQLTALTGTWTGGESLVARDLPLPHLAAVLARCQLFIGHDSGISHLAAAVGTRCVLLFGPTDPDVWAPGNAGAQVLAAPAGDLAALGVEEVWARIET